MSRLELGVWPAGWDLPSIDLHSIIVAARVKFLGLPVKIVEKRNPYFTPAGSLPVLKDGQITIGTYPDIVKYLNENYKVDSHLNPQQKAEAYMFSEYVDIQLFPCLQYMLWANEENFSENTRPQYAKVLPFPFNFHYPARYHREGVEVVESAFPESDLKAANLPIYRRAEECFKMISERLGRNEFFFGDRPSSVDAVVFGYCCMFARAPQKNKMLANYVKALDNLDRYISRIMQRYFPSIHQEYLSSGRKKAETDPEKKDEMENSTRNKFFAVLLAVVAMGGYALSTGILSLNVREEIKNSPEYNAMFEIDEEDN